MGMAWLRWPGEPCLGASSSINRQLFGLLELQSLPRVPRHKLFTYKTIACMACLHDVLAWHACMCAGDEVLFKLRRPWWSELQGRYGNLFYIRDEVGGWVVLLAVASFSPEYEGTKAKRVSSWGHRGTQHTHTPTP